MARFVALALLLLLPCVVLAAPRAPWWSGEDSSYVLDTSLTMQESDTTVAVYIGDCSNLTAVIYGIGADSVNLVVQGSIDGETWADITPSQAAVTNQSLASGGFIRTVLGTNTSAAGAAWIGAGFNRYVRLIVKNNCDATQAAENNTLLNVQAAIVGPCVNER